MANPTVAIGRQSLIARLFKLELDASAPGETEVVSLSVFLCQVRLMNILLLVLVWTRWPRVESIHSKQAPWTFIRQF